MKNLYLLIYYAVLQHIPMQPMPGYQIGYKLRKMVAQKLFKQCGKNIIVKNHCYFGKGDRLKVGNRSQLGQNARLNGEITIGDDCVMGPDVVMMAISHGYDKVGIPINKQLGYEKAIVIGNDCWIGTRVVILPGINIGNHCIIGANAVVTKSFPDNCIIGGVPAKIIKVRKQDEYRRTFL